MSRRTVVIPRVRTRAWYGSEPIDVPTHDVVPVRDALEATYPGESLFVPYAPVESERCPRLGAAALSYWTCRDSASMPTVGVVPVDIDYGDHDVPPDGWHQGVIEQVPEPCGWYRTPHGLRLVFLPREPVPIDRANSYIEQLHEALVPVESDPATRTWYRLFMLPRVLGRELPMDLSGLEPIDWEPSSLTPTEPAAVGPIVERDQPTGDGRSLTKTYLKPISDTRLREDLYAGRLSAPKGERHDTILKVALRICEAYNTEDPLVPYEILEPSVNRMADKTTDELWRICEWTCAQYSGARDARAAERDEIASLAAEDMGVNEDDVHDRLVVDCGAEFFVWDENEGRYSQGYTHSHQLRGALRRHCPSLAWHAIKSKASVTTIMEHHSVVPRELVFTYDHSKTGFDPDMGRMYVPVCFQDPALEPQRHECVAEWLEALFDSRVESGLDWLAAFPRLDRPTCALYLSGPPSVGKQMFALGLARIWSRESNYVPYAEMTGDFNASTKRTPVVWADEKVPQDAFSQNDSSLFRRLVGNTGMKVNEKFKSPASMLGYLRVLITANNDDALSIREELDTHDMEAIRKRLGYIECDEKPIRVLERQAAAAGYDSTRDYTDSWVSGGKIAEHVLWLAENRDIDVGSRFLVEGWESSLTESLPTRVGAAGDVMSTLAMAVLNDAGSDAVRWFGDDVYVNTNLLRKSWSRIVGHSNDRIVDESSMTKALRSLAQGESARLSPQFRDGGRLRYWVIPATLVGQVAEHRGICDASEITDPASRKVEPDTVSSNVLESRTPEV